MLTASCLKEGRAKKSSTERMIGKKIPWIPTLKYSICENFARSISCPVPNFFGSPIFTIQGLSSKPVHRKQVETEPMEKIEFDGYSVVSWYLDTMIPILIAFCHSQPYRYKYLFFTCMPDYIFEVYAYGWDSSGSRVQRK